MFRNKLGGDSLIPKFVHLKNRRQDGVESLTTLKEGEFKVPTDGCINISFKSVCHNSSIANHDSLL